MTLLRLRVSGAADSLLGLGDSARQLVSTSIRSQKTYSDSAHLSFAAGVRASRRTRAPLDWSLPLSVPQTIWSSSFLFSSFLWRHLRLHRKLVLEFYILTPLFDSLASCVPSCCSSSSWSLLMRASATGVLESTSNGESSRRRSSSGWSQSLLRVGRRLLVRLDLRLPSGFSSCSLAVVAVFPLVFLSD